MAFSLPLTLGHQAFTYRNDIIFVAAVVILTSLLVPTIVLPLLLPKQVEKVSDEDLSHAKGEMVTSAIKLIAARYGDTPTASEVIAVLEGQRTVDARPDRAQLSKLFNDTYEIEQQTIDQLITAGEIDSGIGEQYLRVSRTRLQNQQSFWQRLWLFFKFLILGRFSFSKKAREQRKAIHQFKRNGMTREQLIERNRQMWQQMRTVEEKPYHAVVDYLNEQYNDHNHQAISIVRRSYDQRHRRLSGNRDLQEAQNELLIEAFQLEYNFIQTQMATKKISHDLGNQLYEQISTDQLVYLQSVNDD